MSAKPWRVEMGADALEGALRVHVAHHADIHLRLRLVRDDRLRPLLPVAADDAVDIERRLIEVFAQQRHAVEVVLEAAHVVAPQPLVGIERRREGGEQRLIVRVGRFDLVVEAVDEDVLLIGRNHRGERVRQPPGRIAVPDGVRAVDGAHRRAAPVAAARRELHEEDALDAEITEHLAVHILREEGEEGGVRLQAVAVRGDEVRQVLGAHLLLALDHEDDIERQCAVGLLQGFQREQRVDERALSGSSRPG